MMRDFRFPVSCALAASLAGCGGGGGTGVAVGTPAATATSASQIAAPTENVQTVSVEPGPASAVNLPFTSVTVCAPGGTPCQTIDHVVVDTASSGLRILASALSPSLLQALPQQKDDSGNAVGECAQFASGSSWGPVNTADVTRAARKASSIPVQIIGDASFATVPAACSSTGPLHNTVDTLLANGILGVGVFREDCGSACADSASPGFYYACPSTGCQGIALPVARQVQNPVARFASDNNGVILQLPAIPSAGAATAAGALVFGIGTRANNGLGSAAVFGVNPTTGTLTTVYRGRVLSRSFFDSGSNAYFFTDLAIPRCASNPSFYCPSATLALTATVQGANGTVASVDFAVANTEALLRSNPTASAFDNLAGPIGSSWAFDWGLPFFFGRSVYTAFVGASTPAGAGPYIAF